MAHDIFKINIGVSVKTPEYAYESVKQRDEHMHGNKELRRAAYEAVLEQLEAVLPMVVVDGESFEIVVERDTHDVYGPGTDVVLNEAEQAAYDAENREKDSASDALVAEIDRRESEDPDLYRHGVYSIYNWGDGPEILDIAAIEDPCVCIMVVYDYDDNPHESTSAIMNPSNWDVFKMFCQAMRERNEDTDHVYLEGVSVDRVRDDGVYILKAYTGS